MDVVGFNAFGMIEVMIGADRLIVPDDPENTDRQRIATWEAEGNTIPAYVAPAQGLPNLEPDEFWFALRVSGYEQDLRSWVASLNDPADPNYNPVEWAQVSAKLDFAKHFERDHPLVEAARLVLGLDPGELDALWIYGSR